MKREPLDDIGCHMTMAKFIRDVKDGCFIDYDGFGYYAGPNWQTSTVVRPSMVKAGTIDRSFSHVMWYNR